ncbi:MAG TPA: polyphenol oxidase family protein [Candidatus Dormibacteraeota bacterium]|nr:polyphenol oxidase family protein [Candidatus Dormibacteraeota bacterium]
MPSVIHVPGLAGDNLTHGFSTLQLGSVGLTHAKDPDQARESRRRFLTELGLDEASLTVAGAVHGAEVARVDQPQPVVENVDALITDQPGIALFATYADCYPIVLYDLERQAAGLVHAGWRGTEAGVARAAVKAMQKEFGTRPEAIQAGIGPGICGLCYEVGADVAGRFDPRFVRPTRDAFLLDLAAANRAQLQDAGVRDVYALDLCTKETDYLPSHRRDHDGARFGAIVAIHHQR